MYELTEEQAIAIRNFLGEYWTDFLAACPLLSEDDAEALYKALGGES